MSKDNFSDDFKQYFEQGSEFVGKLFGDGTNEPNLLLKLGEKVEDAKHMVTEAAGNLQVTAQEYAFPVMMHFQKVQRQSEDLREELAPVVDEIRTKAEPVVTGLMAGLTALVTTLFSDPDQELKDLMDDEEEEPEED